MNEKVNEQLGGLTEAILASYDLDQSTRRIGETALPDRVMIVSVLEDLRRLLFPGYFGADKKLSPETIRYHVGDEISRLAPKLTEQIRHCLCTDQGCEECKTFDECEAKSEKITLEFLRTIPALRAKLSLDAQAAYDGDPAAKSISEIIYCYPGFYAVVVYRIANLLLNLGVHLMPRIMTEYAHGLTGADIHPGATIGERFFIDHATGVVIGETTNIGNNVKVYQGVTLGALSFPKDERGRVIKGIQRHPTLEDNVTIYANATILGGETVIGRGVTVGGNTFVTKSISEDKTVTSRPADLRVKDKK
ncbi:MAG: serine acetyltransferase [Phycisphaerales bacterium]|jgi:serine O-acetyltransferase|nr:serine acetyltransferase [Phycisphaerales bacterium]MBT7171116.1 serine acetyltransferase [Phycisphaerales bacterium]